MESLAVKYMPLARRIAGRFRRKGLAFDDLCSIGYLALVRAERDWVPGRGASFKTLAHTYVFRAIVTALRSEGRRSSGVGLEEVVDSLFARDGEPQRERLREAVASLPEGDREILSAIYGVGTSSVTVPALCSRLGCPRWDVYQNATRIIGSLRRAMEAA